MKIVYIFCSCICRIYILVCRNCLMAARQSTTEAPITNHLKERKQGAAQMDNTEKPTGTVAEDTTIDFVSLDDVSTTSF